MKRLNISSSQQVRPDLNFLKNINLQRVPVRGVLKWTMKILMVLLVVTAVLGVVGYFMVLRPVLAMAEDAKKVKAATAGITQGLEELNFTQVQKGLADTKSELAGFKESYERHGKTLRRIPGAEGYYKDMGHLIAVADEGVELGDMVVNILEPHAAELGFETDNGVEALNLTAKERVIKFIRLMPQFSSSVSEISERMEKIDEELSMIDASRYPTKLPWFAKYAGVETDVNVREQILAYQAVSHELAVKAPQFEAFFNSVPEFLGLNEPKKYLILMANNYELRMSGGFNTYVVLVEFSEGVPQITYSIDTYFIDEGDRTGSSNLVDRNVPLFLSRYLYIQDRGGRLYARDATSISPDFTVAADELMNRFWRKDRTLPQEINGVIQINNDIAVDILRVVGAVNTSQYSIRTDSGNYITIPITEFNSDNVIQELENISGGKLAQTIGRKEIIKFLGQAILDKIYNSEATNLVNITKVMLDSMSKKDIMLYSFDPNVQQAFENLGYGGRIVDEPAGWDYLHVNRSNFGSGKADWTKEGFVTQEVKKNVEVRDGKKISTVEVTIKNPKRPDWYDIDPCCFYRGYLRVYAPLGSKLISVETSDGQDPQGAELFDDQLNKPYFQSFTVQQKETNLTVKFTYELPDTVNLDDYNIMVQRQPGSSIDPYTIGVNGVSEQLLLNSDKSVSL